MLNGVFAVPLQFEFPERHELPRSVTELDFRAEFGHEIAAMRDRSANIFGYA
jgi:hypothetical protein